VKKKIHDFVIIVQTQTLKSAVFALVFLAKKNHFKFAFASWHPQGHCWVGEVAERATGRCGHNFSGLELSTLFSNSPNKFTKLRVELHHSDLF